MQTRNVQLNTESYTELTSADNFLIQNGGNSVMQVVAADTQPDNDLNGINLKEDEAITQIHITGTLWGKGNCVAIVTD